MLETLFCSISIPQLGLYSAISVLAYVISVYVLKQLTGHDPRTATGTLPYAYVILCRIWLFSLHSFILVRIAVESVVILSAWFTSIVLTPLFKFFSVLN